MVIKKEFKDCEVVTDVYKQLEIVNGKVRLFSDFTNESQLVWHRDEENREVRVISCDDYEFQFDNEVPIKLKKGMKIIIPRGEFHRVIKNNGDLIIKIKHI